MSTKRKLSLRDWESDKGVTKWTTDLGVTDAPVPRKGIRTALRFLQTQMPTLDVSDALGFLHAIDFSREVKSHTLSKGEKVIAFRSSMEWAYKLFYTRSGVSAHSVGLNPRGRKTVQYEVHVPTAVLESRTSGVIDTWSIQANPDQLRCGNKEAVQKTTISVRADKCGVMTTAGCTQLIIPNAFRNLRVIRDGR